MTAVSKIFNPMNRIPPDSTHLQIRCGANNQSTASLAASGVIEIEHLKMPGLQIWPSAEERSLPEGPSHWPSRWTSEANTNKENKETDSHSVTNWTWQREDAATRVLRRPVVKKPRLTAADLQQDLVAAGSEVSVSTVRRTLNADGLRVRTTRLTPLTQKHERSGLQFAQNYMKKPKRFRDSVLWSDETELELFGPMDQRCVWRRETEAVKHGGGSGTLCFSSSGTGNLQRVEGKMDSITKPTEKMSCSLRKLKLWCHWTFQQNSDPKNTSESTKARFQKKS